ncbi:MAG: undecaprenyl-diphosphate phosphatase [Alphaproteobacteria bacterium]|nr:undecaprenyl-diphosphate phosphatase [Alphaproteobacteria bacterium]
MNFDLLFLSLIQGVSEILPVSSSVNLHLFSRLLDIGSFSFSMKVALHAGSLLTFILYFRREIADVFLGLIRRKRLSDTYFFALLFGTLPVVIFGYLARDFVKEFEAPKIMGISCIFFGILLALFDKISASMTKNDRAPVSVMKSLIIGCFQAIAIFPGVSRLGICLTASRMLGLNRRKAIGFSMMLAIPSICGSLVLEFVDCYKRHNLDVVSQNSLIAIGATFVIGLIAITPCVRFMEKHGFFALAIYRIVIGSALCFL